MPFRCTLIAAVACGLTSSVVVANAADRRAAEVATQIFSIATPHGPANEPFLISLDWSQPQPAVARAVIVFHGVGRDVTGYYRTVQDAAQQAGPAGRDTIIIAPQFLDEEDVHEHHLPKEVLRWRRVAWEGGEAAAAPSPISSYTVVDALLARLADRSLFPNLKTVVLAGHSGGGQLVQRYAAVGKSAAVLAAAGIHVRYVIANPSSFLYFSDERPGAGGGGRCPEFDRWKYGPVDPPSYVKLDPGVTWKQREQDYAQRDVIYLLGTADIDPHEKDLDVSCAAETQGPSRLLRGQAYFAYLHTRHISGWNQRLLLVPGVAHSARKMFTSPCGVNALFDTGTCPDQ
ncbi:MAG: alpha/beta hydrolase [Bryobacteraceae bacterium]|jgi:pimeloyl-ACP methyl ester carboxylesterase